MGEFPFLILNLIAYELRDRSGNFSAEIGIPCEKHSLKRLISDSLSLSRRPKSLLLPLLKIECVLSDFSTLT